MGSVMYTGSHINILLLKFSKAILTNDLSPISSYKSQGFLLY